MKNIGNRYDWQGMLIVTLLAVFGVFILYITGITQVTNLEELKVYLLNSLFEVVCAVFFIGTTIYVWILLVLNGIIKPKNTVLYLRNIDENNICEFIDRKGKLFYFRNDDYQIELFYNVTKTHDYIHEIIDVSPDSFEIVGEKKSYWLNFYTPIGNFENLFLLPIVYVPLIPGIVATIVTEGIGKFFGIIFSIVPLFLVLYDAWYKIKQKSGVDMETEIDKEKIFNIFNLIPYIMTISILMFIFINMKILIVRIVLAPNLIYFSYKLFREIVDNFSQK